MQNERTSKEVSTDHGRVMAISQILNGQYHIWDKCVRPENQSFLLENKPNTFFHGQWTHSAKIVQIVGQNTSNVPKFISPKYWDIIEKRLHRASVIRAHYL